VSGPNSRALVIIFGAALLTRLGYVLWSYLTLGPDGLMNQDSALFLELGRVFGEHGQFARESSDGSFVPETERMPLYIIFLGIHTAISGLAEPLFPALTQTVIGAICAVLIALTATLEIGRAHV